MNIRQQLREIGIKYLQIIPLVTFISAGMMYLVFSNLVPESDPDFLITLAAASIYTTVFTVVLVPAFRVMDYMVPVNDFRAVLAHITVMTILTVGCYAGASVVTTRLFYVDSPLDPSGQFIAFLLTVLITIAILAIFYFQYFIRRNRETQQQAVKAELSALRAQINPHFLFNSLNSIAALTRLDAAKSERVTEDLAELFRYSLNASKKEMVTLEEEIEAVQLYLGIEQARFGDRLHTEFRIDSKALHARIPALVVQPLAENAVKHGIQEKPGRFDVTVEARIQGGRLHIRVTDSGPGLDPGKKEAYLAKGTGLNNVANRLRLHFGRRAELQILMNGVELLLPYEPDTADRNAKASPKEQK